LEPASHFAPPAEPAPGRVPLVVLLVLGPLAGLFLARLPLPGLDTEVMEGWAYRREFGLLGSSSVPLLILLRWLLGAYPQLRRLWAAVLLLGSAVAGALQAWALIALDLGASPLVVEPGLAFVLTSALTVSATAALLWWVGDRIDDADLLGSAPALWWCLGPSLALGSQLAHGEALAAPFPQPLWALDPLIWLLPLLWLALRPRSWPLPLVGALRVRSGLEAALTVWAAGSLAGGLVLAVGPELELAVRGLVTLGAIVVLDRETSPGPRSLGAWAALAVAGAGHAALWLLGFLTGGGLQRLQPGPYAGEGDFELVLASATARAQDDAGALEQRLEALGVEVSVEVSGERELRVSLRGVAEPVAPMQAALSRAGLAVSALSRVPPLPVPPGVEADEDGQTYRAPIDTLLRELPAPRGARLVIGCPTPRDCVAYTVGEPVLDGSDIEAASVGFDAQGSPFLALELDDDGTARFGQATAALVGQLLVIDTEGELLAAPLVREAITGGRVHIEPGPHDDPLRWCHEMAAALTWPLSGPWEIASVRAAPAG
jgi:hypothetical protein